MESSGERPVAFPMEWEAGGRDRLTGLFEGWGFPDGPELPKDMRSRRRAGSGGLAAD